MRRSDNGVLWDWRVCKAPAARLAEAKRRQRRPWPHAEGALVRRWPLESQRLKQPLLGRDEESDEAPEKLQRFEDEDDGDEREEEEGEEKEGGREGIGAVPVQRMTRSA